MTGGGFFRRKAKELRKGLIGTLIQKGKGNKRSRNLLGR